MHVGGCADEEEDDEKERLEVEEGGLGRQGQVSWSFKLLSMTG
jgi:hypothetical protein